MLTTLTSVGDRIRQEFGITDAASQGGPDYEQTFTSIFMLHSIEEGSRVDLLGQILLGISSISVTDPIHASICLDLLEEQFELGLRYELSLTHGPRLHGGEKVAGRQVRGLLAILTHGQMEVLRAWQTAAIDFCSADISTGTASSDELERLRRVDRWLQELEASPC